MTRAEVVGTGRTVIHDVDGDSTVHTVRSGETFTVQVDGPARITAVRFAPVEGATAPETTVIYTNAHPKDGSHDDA